jgi:hypothetical protein
MALRPAERGEIAAQLAKVHDQIVHAGQRHFSDLPPVTRGTIVCAVGDARLTIFVWANDVDSKSVDRALEALADQINNDLSKAAKDDFTTISEISESVTTAAEAEEQKSKEEHRESLPAKILRVLDEIIKGASDPVRRSA